MPLGFLAGLAEGFGNEARGMRDKNARQAEIEWKRREKFFEDVVKGEVYGEATPEMLDMAMTDIAEMAQQGGPKGAKGFKAKITGKQEMPTSQLLEAIMSGDHPLYQHYQDGEMDPGQEALQREGIDERVSPSAAEGLAGAAQEANQLTPPPGGRPQMSQVGGAPEGYQRHEIQMPSPPAVPRVGAPKPPGVNSAQSELGDAAMRLAAQGQQDGPMQPSAQRPGGIFKSPDQVADETAGRAARSRGTAAMGEADALAGVREAYPDMSQSDLYGAMSGEYRHPPTSASQHPFASTTITNFKGPDGQVVSANPMKDGRWQIQGTDQTVPPGWVAEKSSGAGAAPSMIVGKDGILLVDRANTGTGAHSYADLGQGDFSPIERNVPITERGRYEDTPGINAAKTAREAVDEAISTMFLNVFQPQPGQLEAAQNEEAAKYGFDSYASMLEQEGQDPRSWVPQGEGQQDLGGGFPQDPQGGSPYPGTPGINPDAGPVVPGAGNPAWNEAGWVSQSPPPLPSEIDYSDIDKLLDYWFNHMQEGQEDLAGGDPNGAYSLAQGNPEYIGMIQRKVQALLERIYGTGRTQR